MNYCEKFYGSYKDANDKIKFLEIIRKNIQNVRDLKEYGKISTANIGDYNFVRKLVR